jgi:hypothetical protein
MNGAATKTGRALALARERFEAAGRALGESRPGLGKFAQHVAALVSAARSWSRAEAAHESAMREYDEQFASEYRARRRRAV